MTLNPMMKICTIIRITSYNVCYTKLLRTSISGINTILKKYALEGDLVEQIKYELSDELVSSDIVGSSAPSIYDSKATIVRADGKNIVLYIWYDNEYGYSLV